jgi:predicted CxxxxCH...CXXCH cytochrome family protein
MTPGQGSSATAGSYQFNCSSCHATPATHANGEAVPGVAAGQVYFGYSTAGMKGTYSYNVTQGSDNGFKWTNGTCSSTYCHSNGNGGAGNNTSFTWASPQGTLGCTGCHGGNAVSGAPISSNKHTAHINNAAVLGAGNNFACVECHAKTVASDTTIGNKLDHVNKYKDYSGVRAGGSASYTDHSCSASYCHSSGK